MVATRDEKAKSQSLAVLGITGAEERLYRWLLAHKGATAQALARALELSPRRARQLLDRIEAKGLVTHSPESPRRYLPSAPDIALRALLLHRQEMLLGTELTIRELQEEANNERHSDDREQMVELITNRNVERQLVEQMQRSAREEFLVLMRVPMRISRVDISAGRARTLQKEAQGRGVHYRSIADRELLDTPQLLRRTREDLEAGEEVRVFPRLPSKMIMADRQVALIPLEPGRLDTPSLLVRSSALLDALRALFELLWERAAPLGMSGRGELRVGEAALELSERARELISLMATGLNDKSMSDELGISTRTLQSRVSELMRVLGARTRFQVGWLAALRLMESEVGMRGDKAG